MVKTILIFKMQMSYSLSQTEDVTLWRNLGHNSLGGDPRQLKSHRARKCVAKWKIFFSKASILEWWQKLGWVFHILQVEICVSDSCKRSNSDQKFMPLSTWLGFHTSSALQLLKNYFHISSFYMHLLSGQFLLFLFPKFGPGLTPFPACSHERSTPSKLKPRSHWQTIKPFSCLEMWGSLFLVPWHKQPNSLWNLR